MARAWKSLARRKVREIRRLNNGNPPPEEGGESLAADRKVFPRAGKRQQRPKDDLDHGSNNGTGVIANGRTCLGNREGALEGGGLIRAVVVSFYFLDLS
ncbi:hypothetical protein L873DRAFT_365397 [Choiromyces venosus 120613-1]|uniref:Uncharacterized protein n=1 Tax=Choiromyces venosus 120613-1 TaxID=1336337 RepID=A0A3N4JX15_9PEZI|nr:hypothetical protein L873DRAFT_365397 [Choiromyces venosus 120613-1]